MIHEALLALWNSPGDIFKTTTEEEWLNDVELREFLHPGERRLLQKIMYIALCYRRIEEFRKTVTTLQTNRYEICLNKNNGSVSQCGQYESDENSVMPGLYVKAFCNGLDDALKSYRLELVKLEEQFLMNPHLTLMYVLSSVEQYSTLFEVLKKMIRMVQMEKMHGSLLMGRLHMYIGCGIPSIVHATNRIIKCVNTVFYRHLCNWVIYGDLVDVYNEFFIGDGNCPDENFMYAEQLTQDVMTTQTFRRKRITRPNQVRKFYIKTDMLPSVISLDTAEMILFMGRIVWIVCNDPKKTLDENRHLKFKRDIWEGKSIEYYQKIQQLENHAFNLAKFDRTIEECRLKLTKYLWTVMVEEAKLLEHLQLVRDYYALGRGELFQQFIVAAEKHLSDMSNDFALRNLNSIFAESAMKMYGENDRSYLKFELALAKSSEKENSLNPWSCLEINFDILWPLHIVFHPKIIELYNKLFCFLLRITKTQIDLHKLWHVHMSSKENIDKTVWTLRHNLMFFVNNLQYYLQVDVIEAEFSLLKEAVKTVNEFEDIIRLHSKFLSNLLSKTFVMSLNKNCHEEHAHNLYQLPPVNFEEKNAMYSIILLLLELCDEFCLVATTWDVELTEVNCAELDELTKRTDSLTDMLLRVLYTIHKKVSGPHLLQLLHRLDFNRWFSRSKPDFNLTAA